MECSICISLMLKIDLVPLNSIDVVSEVIDDSSDVDAVFIHSSHVFYVGAEEIRMEVYSPVRKYMWVCLYERVIVFLVICFK
jgi:hypothetical protein